MKNCQPENTAVISVNYRKADMTLKSLESILSLKNPPLTIIIVDNGSNDSSSEVLFSGWQQLAEKYGRTVPVWLNENQPFPAEGDVLLSCTENRGFSAGNNAALVQLLAARAECNTFWLLNNDAFPERDALAELCSTANRTQAALIGSTTVYAADSDCVQCAGGGSISSFTGVTRFLFSGDSLNKVLAVDADLFNQDLDYINGASLLIRREVFELIGMLPEEYFLYCEDMAFCTKARQSGFKMAWAQKSIVTHAEGGSSPSGKKGAKNKLVEYYSIRNRLLFIRTFFPRHFFVAVCGALGSVVLRIIRRHWDNIPMIFTGIRDAVHGVWGKYKIAAKL